MYTVYGLHNPKHDKIYIGQTERVLDERQKEHNDHIFKNSYTGRFDGTWEIVYTEQHNTRQEALKREKQLKSYQGRQFIKKLIKRK